MKNSRLGILKHALYMVKRTLKNYMLLSVTVILSFSVLLGFMMFEDSQVYNENKEILNADNNIVLAYEPVGNEMISDALVAERMKTAVEQIKKTQEVVAYEYFQANGGMRQYSEDLFVNFFVIPNDIPGFYEPLNYRRVKMLDGGEFHIKKNEVIVTKTLYDIIRKAENQRGNKGEVLDVGFQLNPKMDDEKIIHCRVVGICDDIYEKDSSDDKEIISCQAFLSQDTFEEDQEKLYARKLFVYSDNASYVTDVIEKSGLHADSTQKQKEQVKYAFASTARYKYLIMAIMAILLGINLYSSFHNSLHERRYEIGVKRAIGASKFQIVRQFLYEALCVMFVNIMISVVCVINILLCYKVYRLFQTQYQKEWIIYFNPYTIISFIICSIFLSIIFSILFAIQSTKVEIVKYLKEE